jgi:hypothetical protein
MGLWWLNGHAVGGGSGDGQQGEEKKRLIVEFVIENAVVGNRRQDRERKDKFGDGNKTPMSGRDRVTEKGDVGRDGSDRHRERGTKEERGKGKEKGKGGITQGRNNTREEEEEGRIR